LRNSFETERHFKKTLLVRLRYSHYVDVVARMLEQKVMRKVRDYDAELKALGAKSKALKARKVEQLGALVTATGADALDVETLAGVLLSAVASKDRDAKEAWASRGAAFFQRRSTKTVARSRGDKPGAGTSHQSDTAG
jgi:hypothetical protein